LSTTTATDTITFAFADIREVWRAAGQEITTICRLAGAAAMGFDPDSSIIDVNLLAMNGVISAAALEIYIGSELVRRYHYRIVTDSLASHGPDATNPPMGAVPPGARVRLTATPNPQVPKPERDAWFSRLGWKTATPLDYPGGTKARAYGAFVSGGYGLERSVLVNPKYDQPLDNQEIDQFAWGGEA